MRWRIDWTARIGRRAVLALTFTAAALYACQESVITGPGGGGTPPPPTSSVPVDVRPPRVDAPFAFEGNIGFTLFAGARASREEIRLVFSRAQSRLGPRAYARVCAEVQSWPGGDRPWLPRGVTARPFDETAPAYLQIERFLDETARIHGAQVLLVAVCNLKEDGTSPANREKWVRTVARLASEYEHVALEVVNEWKHPNSSVTEPEMASLLGAARAEFNGLIGTDGGVRRGDLRYPAALRGLVSFVSVHPCRTDERPGGLKCGWRGGGQNPTRADLRELVEKNGPVVLSETTAYDGQFGRLGGGCCTEDRNVIIRYVDDCRAVDGCDFVYHCVGCLGWPETEIVWMPDAS